MRYALPEELTKRLRPIFLLFLAMSPVSAHAQSIGPPHDDESIEAGFDKDASRRQWVGATRCGNMDMIARVSLWNEGGLTKGELSIAAAHENVKATGHADKYEIDNHSYGVNYDVDTGVLSMEATTGQRSKPKLSGVIAYTNNKIAGEFSGGNWYECSQVVLFAGQDDTAGRRLFYDPGRPKKYRPKKRKKCRPETEQWLALLSDIDKDIRPGRLSPALKIALSKLYGDDVFREVFGKPFSEFSAKEAYRLHDEITLGRACAANPSTRQSYFSKQMALPLRNHRSFGRSEVSINLAARDVYAQWWDDIRSSSRPLTVSYSRIAALEAIVRLRTARNRVLESFDLSGSLGPIPFVSIVAEDVEESGFKEVLGSLESTLPSLEKLSQWPNSAPGLWTNTTPKYKASVQERIDQEIATRLESAAVAMAEATGAYDAPKFSMWLSDRSTLYRRASQLQRDTLATVLNGRREHLESSTWRKLQEQYKREIEMAPTAKARVEGAVSFLRAWNGAQGDWKKSPDKDQLRAKMYAGYPIWVAEAQGELRQAIAATSTEEAVKELEKATFVRAFDNEPSVKELYRALELRSYAIWKGTAGSDDTNDRVDPGLKHSVERLGGVIMKGGVYLINYLESTCYELVASKPMHFQFGPTGTKGSLQGYDRSASIFVPGTGWGAERGDSSLTVNQCLDYDSRVADIVLGSYRSGHLRQVEEPGDRSNMAWTFSSAFRFCTAGDINIRILSDGYFQTTKCNVEACTSEVAAGTTLFEFFASKEAADKRANQLGLACR